MIIRDEDLFFLDKLNDPLFILDEENKIVYKNKSFNESMENMQAIQEHGEDEWISANEYFKILTYNHLSKLQEGRSLKINIKFYNSIEKHFKISFNNSIFNNKKVFLLSIQRKLINTKEYLEINKKSSSENYISSNVEIHRRNAKNNISMVETINSEIINKALLYSPNIIMIKKDKKIVFINKSAERLLNIKDEFEVIGKDFYDILTFESHQRKHKKNIFENDYLYNTLPLSQVKLKTFKGKEIYVDVCFMSFFEGDEEYSVLIAKDISKKVKIEEKLLRNEEYYKNLLQFLPYGVAIINKNKITFSNENFATMLGENSVKDVINNDISSYIQDNDKKIINSLKEKLSQLKQVEFTEVILTRKDGKKLEVELGSSPFLFENRFSAIVVMYDITERKNAERDKYKLKQALKYDKLKTEFIANISHELKTPLNIILSIVQLFQLKKRESKHIEDNVSKRYVNVVTQNCYRLLRLINNLIDISRIDVGHLKMNFGNYDIVKIVEDITMSTVEHIESKNLKLVFDTDVEEKIIGVDRENMERIMLNLLSNAIKCSKTNGVIWVNIYDDNNFIKISVKDNGIGIPEDMQKRIFERFVQSSPLFTRTYEGSGIGLSLVKALVDAHGGSICVRSKVGVGSEFIVSLPNRLSKKDPTFLKSKLMEDNNSYNVDRIKIEFSDIYS